MAHRPDAIFHCDTLLVLENGTKRAYGPKDEVLQQVTKNRDEIVKAAGKGAGVS
jgi:ABC-type protease/lipase transport system fused ATPase/permease subunit